jgi:hypothetical protein
MMQPVSKLYKVNDRTINEYGAIGGIRTGRGNQGTWGNPTPIPLHLPQIPHDLTWD